MARRARRWTAAMVGALLAVVAAGCGLGRDEPLPDATRLCDLGRSNAQEVAGHDLAASTRLSDGRTLFVFGDTYVGEAGGDTRSSDVLLSSSGAVLPSGSGVCEESLTYLSDTEGRVRALLPPSRVVGQRSWPIDVAARDGRVWMLYRWVQRIGPGPLEVAVKGTGVAVADEDALRFEPLDDLLVEGDAPLPAALAVDDDGLVVLVCDGDGREASDRCRLRRLLTGSSSDDAARLGPALEDVPPLDLAAAEMSLERITADGRPRWRVSSMPDLSCVLRAAVLVEGRWEVAPVLAPDVPHGQLCYAGRIQEPFSTGTSLTVTWVDAADPPTDADLYWPHVEAVAWPG